jgi:hypothetical protein
LTTSLRGDRVTLAGRIDETAQLAQLVAQLPAGPLVIDPEGVTFVNSVGMREWIRFLRGAREGREVALERVADVLMTQMNLIGELRGLPIRSFHAQYECRACRAEAQPLVDAVAHRDALDRLALPTVPCQECGAAMELADFPERYLSIFRS